MHRQVNAVVWWEWENFRPEPWDKRWPTSVPLGAIWLDFCWPIVGRVFETKSLQDFGYSIAPLLEEVAEKDSTLALLGSENMDDVEQLVFRSGILVDLPGHVAKCHGLISCLLSNVPLRVCWVWMISKHIDLGDTSFSGLKIRHLPMTPQNLLLLTMISEKMVKDGRSMAILQFQIDHFWTPNFIGQSWGTTFKAVALRAHQPVRRLRRSLVYAVCVYGFSSGKMK